jgi:hypothetical protein
VEAFLASLNAAPTGAVALVTAALAGLVAILVVVLSQWVLSHRARSEHLTKKLEELYGAIGESRTAADGRTKRARELVLRPPARSGDPTEFVHFSRDLPLDRRVSMYVHLYFPELRTGREDLAIQNQKMVAVFHQLSEGKPVTVGDVWRADLDMRESFDAFEKELLTNRAVLARETLRRRPYVRVANKKAETGAET